jgi:hypothetical protein
MDGRALAGAIGAWFLMMFFVAFALGGLVVWGLPKLWHWLKPLIHQVTA